MSLRALTLAALTALPLAGVSAQDLKIGFVNSERVVRESNLAKLAQAKLEAEFGRREKDLKDAAARLQAAGEKFEKDAPLLSEAQRTSRQRELVETERDLQRKRREFQEDAQARRNEELQVVVERANKVIKQIFEAEKFDLILQDAIHASNRVDITKRVIDALNAQK
ncbi:outer membrane protein [Inhella inkyongensis]|uniref:Outer membrane protein n=2 Tax=Inhella inkyongensis TaxID=392593 RepID=A0A840S2W8_9BURK|nr:OmpH family outer membrane protein [Inhella inkyongensis]MBB5203758.1 outer membrane protein [Inhella inkyongensis]